MKNKRQKGKELVKKVKQILEAEGYMVQVCNPKLMFIGKGKVISREEDFFGRWDIVAAKQVKLGSPENSVRWIQVSTFENLAAKKKQVTGFPLGPHSQEIWCWLPGGKNGHFRVFKGPSFEWSGECKLPIKK